MRAGPRIIRPTEGDLAAYRALIDAALAATAAPGGSVAGLLRARKGSRNRVVPAGPPTRAHPFVQLARQSDAYLAEPALRPELAAGLKAAAQACLAMLDARGRADIEG